MKRNGLILVIVILNVWLVACQGEEIPPTKEVILQPPAEEVAENPSPSDPGNDESTPVPENIIKETNITTGATPTFTPTPTPTSNEGAASGGGAVGGGGEGGATSGSQSLPETSINSGAYEGAILETQFGSGGGGGGQEIPIYCLSDEGLINLRSLPAGIKINEMPAYGCILVDGFPVIIEPYYSIYGPSVATTLDLWANPGAWEELVSGMNNYFSLQSRRRIVFLDFAPYENISVLFYEGDGYDPLYKAPLIGWQNVQVDSRGFLLMKLSPSFSVDNVKVLVQRSNGNWIPEDPFMEGVWKGLDDYDGDGIPDYDEVYGGYNLDFKNPDTDNDGLSDGEELKTYNTYPHVWDSDEDGRSDGQEVLTDNTNPTVPDSVEVVVDSDGDGLTDEEEVATYGTDPQNQDTDGDGRSDGDEIAFGTDPKTTMNAQDVVAVGLADGAQFYREYNTEFPWVLSSSEGDFYFQEDRRGPWGIYLYDPARDLNVYLDFWTKEMSCNDVVCGTVEWVSLGRACPFVFTYDGTAQKWTFDTTIITELVGPASEQPQWSKLERFDGRLLIREVEPEISYLDQVYVVVVSSTGEQTILTHDFAPLQTADDVYHIMHTGDALELTFAGYEALKDISQIWVVAEGYYESLSEAP